MVKFLKFFFISFLSFLSSISFAQQGQISGKLSLTNGEPAAFAVIYIEDLKKYCTADEEGSYLLEAVPYGNHMIQVKTIQAQDLVCEITMDKPLVGFSPVLTERGDYNMNQVVVWGKSEEQKLKESGFSMNVVNMRKMELQSLQTTELLDRTAGIRIRQSGGMGSDIQYNINGLTGNSVRVFIDGIPVRNYGSSFSLTSIPPSMIERVEVYKGVVPAELAEDALGGAINIILRKKARNSLSTSYSYGSFNTHRWDMNGSYSAPQSGFTVSGSAFYNATDNSYKVWGEDVYVTEPATGEMTYVKAKRFHDQYVSYGVNADIGFMDTRWADRFTLGVLYSGMEKDIQHGAVMSTVYGDRTTGQQTMMGSVKYEKRNILRNLDVNIFGSYSHALRDVTDTLNYRYNWYGTIYEKPDGSYYTWSTTGEAGKATLAENTENMWAARGNVTYRFLPGHQLNTNYLYNRFTRKVDDPMLSEAEQALTETRYMTKAILGFTYQGLWWKEKVRTTLFYKYYYKKVKVTDPKQVNGEWVADNYDSDMSSGGYGGAISYAVVPNLYVLFSAEKALRLPGDTELLGNTSENVSASYDLQPESSVNLNLGLNAGPFQLNASHSIGGNINFFYRNITDMITRAVPETSGTKVEDTFQYINLDNVLSKGFDVELFYNYRNGIILTTNFSLFNARFNTEFDTDGNRYSYYRDRLRNAPYMTSNTNLEWIKNDLIQKDSRFSIYYNLGYVHEFYRHWESRGSSGKQIIPKQVVHDLGLAYSFPERKVTISLDVRNFTNEQVFDNWALQKAGRAIYGKITYKIF